MILFSVIVPTYNRPGPLASCLQSLQMQLLEEHYEILVVDDGGCVDLSGIAQAGRIPVRLLRQDNGGPGAARNLAASLALGKYLVFIDDDCLADPFWLEDYARGFGETPKALLGGRVLTPSERNLYCHASQLVLDMALGFFNRNPEQARFFSSNNFAVPRAAFLESSGFLGQTFRLASEDREFCDRWAHSGGHLRALPRAVVFHQPDLNFLGYARMYFRYGRGAARYHQVRRARRSGTLKQDTRFHLQLPQLLLARLGGLPYLRRFGLIMLLMVWQLSNLAGFLYEALLMAGKSFPGAHIGSSPEQEDSNLATHGRAPQA